MVLPDPKCLMAVKSGSFCFQHQTYPLPPPLLNALGAKTRKV